MNTGHSFKKVAVVGVGLLGGSLALALKRTQREMLVYGYDMRSVIKKALAMQAIDRAFYGRNIVECVNDVDLVFLATPIAEILRLLPEIAAAVAPGTLVSDVGSTKREIAVRARTLFLPNVYFIGGHPMTGSEKRGIAAADPYLFENATYVLTAPDEVPAAVVISFAQLLESIGARPVLMEAEVHDRIAAAVSHLPQLLAVLLVNCIGQLNADNPFYLKMAAGGFRDMTRIASSPFELWRDILKTNEKNIVQMIELFIAWLEEGKVMLRNTSLQNAFEQALATRFCIPKDSKGFIHPHYDISLLVEDRPGVIAAFSAVLAAAEINIKDIEVLKVREGEGGTIRIALENETDRRRALVLLAENGFMCKKSD